MQTINNCDCDNCDCVNYNLCFQLTVKLYLCECGMCLATFLSFRKNSYYILYNFYNII